MKRWPLAVRPRISLSSLRVAENDTTTARMTTTIRQGLSLAAPSAGGCHLHGWLPGATVISSFRPITTADQLREAPRLSFPFSFSFSDPTTRPACRGKEGKGGGGRQDGWLCTPCAPSKHDKTALRRGIPSKVPPSSASCRRADGRIDRRDEHECVRGCVVDGEGGVVWRVRQSGVQT